MENVYTTIKNNFHLMQLRSDDCSVIVCLDWLMILAEQGFSVIQGCKQTIITFCFWKVVCLLLVKRIWQGKHNYSHRISLSNRVVTSQTENRSLVVISVEIKKLFYIFAVLFELLVFLQDAYYPVSFTKLKQSQFEHWWQDNNFF